MNKYLEISPEVKVALERGMPVVALESSIISHGMPYPQNVEAALKVEELIRAEGAIPATVAVIDGKLKAGLSRAEIEYLGKKGAAVPRASRRDLPVLVARGADGATTVATTMMIAAMADIKIFAAADIGGVHRGAETTMDISADLEELSRTPVMVVCAGVKSVLDIGRTLEYLETRGVPVIGYGTEEFPAFYTPESGFKAAYRVDTPEQLAAAFEAQREMGLPNGMLVANPVPAQYALDRAAVDKAIEEAIAESVEKGIKGKEITPFLNAKVKEVADGSPESNLRILLNNARVAARTAGILYQ